MMRFITPNKISKLGTFIQVSGINLHRILPTHSWIQLVKSERGSGLFMDRCEKFLVNIGNLWDNM